MDTRVCKAASIMKDVQEEEKQFKFRGKPNP
jgi:hypothetical protein